MPGIKHSRLLPWGSKLPHRRWYCASAFTRVTHTRSPSSSDPLGRTCCMLPQMPAQAGGVGGRWEVGRLSGSCWVVPKVGECRGLQGEPAHWMQPPGPADGPARPWGPTWDEEEGALGLGGVQLHGTQPAGSAVQPQNMNVLRYTGQFGGGGQLGKQSRARRPGRQRPPKLFGKK